MSTRSEKNGDRVTVVTGPSWVTLVERVNKLINSIFANGPCQGLIYSSLDFRLSGLIINGALKSHFTLYHSIEQMRSPVSAVIEQEARFARNTAP